VTDLTEGEALLTGLFATLFVVLLAGAPFVEVVAAAPVAVAPTGLL